VEVDIEGTTNQDDGMVVNYDVLKDVINSIDHKHLNDVIDYHPLTAENICQWLRIQLNSAVLDQGRTAEVIRVLVKETESSYAEWTR
jgi:6-pyruvoyl-tetrahydropterin synthase